MQKSLALSLLLLVSACSTVATQAPPPPRPADEAESAGLFPSDAELLSDEHIVAILDSRWQVPEHVRIALLPLSHESVFSPTYYYGGYLAQARAAGLQNAERAVEVLRALPGVYDVSYLPAFLLPAARSVPLVREAAARYQADWVLLYAVTVSAHPEARFLASDRVRGLCLVECALLDTRSGLIPFTARSTVELDAKQASGETLALLALRGEQEAVDAAMLENARALASFLEQRGGG